MSRSKTRRVGLRGRALIREPLLNKGSAFSARERTAFGLEGLLPARTQTIELQAQRIRQSLARATEPLDKYVALAALQDRNEHLYFHVLASHLTELMPIVYTPTVGQATRYFSHVFQRGRGVWITPDDRGRIRELLSRSYGQRRVRLLVVTDNESILGIGDQGAGGMAISIGKLALYTAIAGVDPARVLPVSFDVGTENEALLADPLYLGWPQRRLRGEAYLSLLDEFVAAVAALFPGALVQWEDFRKDNALRVLDRYRETLPSFNDDIQGTGAVALAGIFSAARITQRRLTDERVVVLGAGAAGLGIARQIRAAMQAEGLTKDDAIRAVAVLDSRGLIVADGSQRDAYKAELAWPAAAVRGTSLETDRSLAGVVARLRPTVLIGTSGQPGAFGEALVREMASHCERPLIMPLSNPTDQSEARPAELLAWTDGRALVATGSPFDPVELGERRVHVGQGNNAFIFPAVGLGALAGRTRVVSDAHFAAAARALADTVMDEELADGLLYPRVARARAVAMEVAGAVLRVSQPGLAAAEAVERIRRLAWDPAYEEYEPE